MDAIRAAEFPRGDLNREMLCGVPRLGSCFAFQFLNRAIVSIREFDQSVANFGNMTPLRQLFCGFQEFALDLKCVHFSTPLSGADYAALIPVEKT
jgi:hypothetical protein